MLVSFCYVLLRWLLEFVALYGRSKDFTELEIIVLRHELAVLRRTTRRPPTTVVDRMFLAAASRLLPRSRWQSFIVIPETLLRWHRRLSPFCASPPVTAREVRATWSPNSGSTRLFSDSATDFPAIRTVRSAIDITAI